MAHWFTSTGGCTQAQAAKLDAIARSLGMGDGAGISLFAKAHGCSTEKARHRMSIKRADYSIAWAREQLTALRHRRSLRPL